MMVVWWWIEERLECGVLQLRLQCEACTQRSTQLIGRCRLQPHVGALFDHGRRLHGFVTWCVMCEMMQGGCRSGGQRCWRLHTAHIIRRPRRTHGRTFFGRSCRCRKLKPMLHSHEPPNSLLCCCVVLCCVVLCCVVLCCVVLRPRDTPD